MPYLLCAPKANYMWTKKKTLKSYVCTRVCAVGTFKYVYISTDLYTTIGVRFYN